MSKTPMSKTSRMRAVTSSVTRHVNRVTHRGNRDRARRTTRLAVIGSAAAAMAGLLVAVPFVSGSSAAPTAPGSPVGHVEQVTARPGGLHFVGWAYDPDTTRTTWVVVSVDNKQAALVPANLARPDLGRSVPRAVGHGLDASVLIPAGEHTVCVTAINRKGTQGAKKALWCRTSTFNYNPAGALSTFGSTLGRVRVAGWAADPDSPASALKVAVAIDDRATTVVANGAAPSGTPAAGIRHGFSVAIPATQGVHRVCVTFYNVSYGANTVARCAASTLNDSPKVHVQTLAKNGTGIRLAGWALDTDAPSQSLTLTTTVDGRSYQVPANRGNSYVAKTYAGAGSAHGFDVQLPVTEGNHSVCTSVPNVGYGSTTTLPCSSVPVLFTPKAVLTSVTPNALGATIAGYASDPDTSKPISTRISAGSTATTVTANGKAYGGHAFSHSFVLRSGAQTLCAVAMNTGAGTHNSPSACKTLTLALKPLAHLDAATRAPGSTAVRVTGWAFDPDTTGPITYAVTIDGASAGIRPTTASRPDVTKAYPSAGSGPHGIGVTLPASENEHTVCVTAVNVGGGTNTPLGCKVINAVHPKPPSAVRSVSATPTYGAATIRWAAPASDGGAPVAYYTVTSGTSTVKVAGTSYTATKLAAKTRYTFAVRAVNVAGGSAPVAIATTTPSGPAPQTTPAPVSTSRYIRNIRGASAGDLATMRAEGVADAKRNPSGHRYLVLLDIGGQDQYDGGVILSATTRFVSYGNLVKAVDAYIDGYASAQKGTAPVTVAIGTNNDVDVSTTSGRQWADNVVDPIRAYAAKYRDVGVAGANDIEPGFRGSYSATSAWVKGYLASTTAGFVFNGSADGCAYTVTNRSCNNGWSMMALYNVAQGFGPGRIVNLPQVYNTTMAAQWKYISLTGVQYAKPRIVFGGPLTEYTACAQARSCGSLGGTSAWREMWKNLQSDSRLRVSSLPYSTDLRIDS